MLELLKWLLFKYTYILEGTKTLIYDVCTGNKTVGQIKYSLTQSLSTKIKLTDKIKIIQKTHNINPKEEPPQNP